jgi:hypothetical protein
MVCYSLCKITKKTWFLQALSKFIVNCLIFIEKKYCNMKNTITLNEEQFRTLVTECVQEVLIQEGAKEFFGRLKAGATGAIKGYQTQALKDRGVEGFKDNWGYEDFAKQANPFGPGAEDTAAMRAEKLLAQARYYSQEAIRLTQMANKLTYMHKLKKTAPNKRETTRPANLGPVPDFNNAGGYKPGNKFGSKTRGKRRTNPTGLFGA